MSNEMPAASTSTTILNASPFQLRSQDVDLLAQSEGFSILRAHLAHHYNYALCVTHTSSPASGILLMRDVLHALLVPIVELYDKALTLASTAVAAGILSPSAPDLSFAFTNRANPAFTHLRSFLSSPASREWCFTRGCPACIVAHSLASDACIRLLHAACLLSDVHYPFTLDGPTLPSFRFFLDALGKALARDSRWGDGVFDAVRPQAENLRDGIEELILQCVELDFRIGSLDADGEQASVLEQLASTCREQAVAQAGMKIEKTTVSVMEIPAEV